MKSKLVPFTVLIGLLPVSANDSSFDRFRADQGKRADGVPDARFPAAK